MSDDLSALWLSIGLGALFAVVVLYALWRLFVSHMVSGRPAKPQALASAERQAQASMLGRVWQLLNRPIWRPRR